MCPRKHHALFGEHDREILSDRIVLIVEISHDDKPMRYTYKKESNKSFIIYDSLIVSRSLCIYLDNVFYSSHIMIAKRSFN